MGLVLVVALALMLWIVLWSVGAGAFDAFMVTTAIVLIGAFARVLGPYLPGRSR